MRISTLLIISSVLLNAENFSNSLSSQGFTGLINTPNAQVIEEGDATFQFNNQFDNHLRNYNYNNLDASEENYIIGIGLFPNLEVVGRLVEVGRLSPTAINDFSVRDLSANFKYKIPHNYKYFPNIALGIQDIGGEDNHYDNTYIVADKQFSFVRTSIGYGRAGENIKREFGKNDTLSKRMDGLFGGVEAKVTDWFSVVAEHDGQENHAAIRVAVPNSLLSSVKVEGMLAQNLTESQTHFALNLTVPLFKNTSKLPYPEEKKPQTVYPQAVEAIPNVIQKLKPIVQSKNQGNTLLAIQNKLVKFGFQNVQVGKYKDSIYIKCENSMFDHTDLDALGYIIGNISSSYKKSKHYIVTLLKNNLQTITVSGDSKDFQNYLEEPTPLHSQKLKENLAFSRTFNEGAVIFISSKKNSSFFKPHVELSPGLLTTIGTEVGVFDYLATLRANVYMPIYDGLVLSAMHETPLIHSDNFDDDKVYGKRNANRLHARLVTAMAHQTVHYESLLNTLSVGQYQADYLGLLNQTNLTTASGEHGVALKVGSFQHRNSNITDDREFYLGSYRYFYEPLNLFTEVMYGQYWNQDKGTTLEFKRFFDQTAVSLYVKDVGFKYAGITVSFPLTTRKLYNSKIIQVKGKNDFNYGIRTTLQEPTGGNIQRPNGGIIPKSDFELASTYLDRDRLNGSYIKNNIERMRDAYITYGSLVERLF